MPDMLAFLRYFSMSKALISPAQMLLCRVSKTVLWSGSGRTYEEDKPGTLMSFNNYFYTTFEKIIVDKLYIESQHHNYVKTM